MDNKNQTKSNDCKAVHLRPASSERIHEENSNPYLCEKRICKARYDSGELELGSTDPNSCRGSRSNCSNATVTFVSFTRNRKDTVEVNIHSGRIDKKKPVDFYTETSSEITTVENPNSNSCTCLKRKDAQIFGSDSRQSKRITKTTSILPEPMTNVVFDHCFRTIWSKLPEERKNMCTYLTCYFFYTYVPEESRDKVLRWVNRLDIFSKKYVFVPILLWSHWTLLVFCNLGESLHSKTVTPCMVLLDSLHQYGSSWKLEHLIRRFVLDIFKTEGRTESKDMIEKIPLLVPKVPQQTNCVDCGIFVLYYVKKFIKSAPENFSVSNGYPYFMTEDWFTENRVERLYKKLEALGLQSD